jgi:hypothetical protein
MELKKGFIANDINKNYLKTFPKSLILNLK